MHRVIPANSDGVGLASARTRGRRRSVRSGKKQRRPEVRPAVPVYTIDARPALGPLGDGDHGCPQDGRLPGPVGIATQRRPNSRPPHTPPPPAALSPLVTGPTDPGAGDGDRPSVSVPCPWRSTGQSNRPGSASPTVRHRRWWRSATLSWEAPRRRLPGCLAAHLGRKDCDGWFGSLWPRRSAVGATAGMWRSRAGAPEIARPVTTVPGPPPGSGSSESGGGVPRPGRVRVAGRPDNADRRPWSNAGRRPSRRAADAPAGVRSGRRPDVRGTPWPSAPPRSAGRPLPNHLDDGGRRLDHADAAEPHLRCRHTRRAGAPPPRASPPRPPRSRPSPPAAARRAPPAADTTRRGGRAARRPGRDDLRRDRQLRQDHSTSASSWPRAARSSVAGRLTGPGRVDRPRGPGHRHGRHAAGLVLCSSSAGPAYADRAVEAEQPHHLDQEGRASGQRLDQGHRQVRPGHG